MLPRVTLDQLSAFHQVVEAGGFARAAPGDPSRQSLLNRQVRQVERALGVPLLERRGRGVEPTAAGQRLRAVLASLIDGMRDVAAEGKDMEVDLTLSGGDSLLQWLVLPRLAGVRVAAPRVRFTLFATSNAVEDVAAGVAHFGLSRERDLPNDLTQRALDCLSYALFVPRRLLGIAQEPLSALLAALPLVRVSGDPDAMDEALAMAGIAPAPALTVETFPQAARAVATGQFAAVLPTIATAALDADRVDHRPLELPTLGSVRLALVARTRTLESRPAVRAAFSVLARALQRAEGTTP